MVQWLEFPFLKLPTLKLAALVISKAGTDNPGIVAGLSQFVDLANDPWTQAWQDFVQAVQADKGMTVPNRGREGLTVVGFQAHSTGDVREIGIQILSHAGQIWQREKNRQWCGALLQGQ